MEERNMGLFRRMREAGEQAILYRNALVEENMRLVSHVLKKWRPYTDDQYQAGCMGLIVAVDTFKEERGVPFASYACFCIEREIHRMHRYQNTLIENILNDKMVYLNALIKIDDDEVSQEDLIADVLSEEVFERIIDENDLQKFFDDVVNPSVDMIAGATKGQIAKTDMDKWRQMELRYLLESAREDSQKIRFNMSQMARALGTSVQNVRTRHQRVLLAIRHKCKECGYGDI